MTEATVQVTPEQLTPQLCDEVDKLVKAYYDSTPAHTGLPPYDFNWPVYMVMWNTGALTVLTARDHGQLVGIVMYVTVPNPHHKTWYVAECDTLAVDHTRRGAGIGRMLVEAGLVALKSVGVKLVSHRFRTCYGTTPLFEQLGFNCAELVFVKEL